MKKLILVLFVLVIGMGMALFMTACGGSSGSSEEESGGGEAAATKTLAYFNEFVSGGAYTMEMEAEYQDTVTVMTSAVKDGMLYSKSEVNGTESIMIMKDDVQYLLDPASRMCMKMSITEESVTEMFADEAANYETAASTGSEEINGETLDYEEFTVEDTSVKYYFSGNDLKYIATSVEGESYVAEILSMTKGADDSLFEVPEDYTMYEM